MRIRTFAVMLLLLGVLAKAWGGEAPLDARHQELEKQLQIAVDLFETGRYIEARSHLDKIGALSDADAWKLREAFGARILNQMASFFRNGLSVGTTPVEILRRAASFDQSEKLAPKYIKQMVSALVRDPQKNASRFQDLMLIGPYAVPDLVDYMRRDVDDVERVNAEYILVQMGPQVAIPVSVALEGADNVMLQQCLSVLARMRPTDPRVLGYIKAVYENAELLPTVRAWAKKALDSVARSSADSAPSAGELCLREARRLYLGGAIVKEEVLDLRGAFWMWDPKANNGAGRLRFLKVPSFVLADVMAQQRAYKAMDLLKGNAAMLTRAHLLVSSSLLQQVWAMKANAAVLGMETIRVPDLKKHEDMVKKWRDHLYKAERVAATIGAYNLVSVLAQALKDNKIDVAKAALEGIQFVGRERGWAMISNWTPAAAPVATVSTATEKKTESAPATETKADSIDDNHQGHDQNQAKADAANDENVQAASQTTAKAGEPEAISAMASKSPEQMVAAAAAARRIVAGSGNPLLRALSYPHRQVRITAANVLVAIGLPTSHPAYHSLIPILTEGVLEKSAKICLVIHHDPLRRQELAKMLRAAGVIPVLAASGREGLALATRYPPKDAILIDAELQEFAQIRHRLLVQRLIPGSPLPVVVVTHSKMVEAVRQQFPESTWQVYVTRGDPADIGRLYRRLVGQQKAMDKKQVLTIVTNNDISTHVPIKNGLILEAERQGRPARATEWLNLMRQKSLTAEIYPVRSTLVNVFVDSEVSGFNVPNTVKELRKDPRSSFVPIGILVDRSRQNAVSKQFAAFIRDKADVRILDSHIKGKALEEAVTEMTALNPLNKEGRNYVRNESDSLSERSSGSLVQMNKWGVTGTLTEGQAVALRKELLDRSRPVPVRTGIADVLGVFDVTSADKTLAKVFRDTEVKDTGSLKLKVHAMDNLGMVDRDNSFKDLKYTALDDPNVPVQEAGARAIALANGGVAWRDEVYHVEQPNNGLLMLHKGLTKPGEQAASLGTEEVGGEVIRTTKKKAGGEEEPAQKKTKGKKKKDKGDADGGDPW